MTIEAWPAMQTLLQEFCGRKLQLTARTTGRVVFRWKWQQRSDASEAVLSYGDTLHDH